MANLWAQDSSRVMRVSVLSVFCFLALVAVALRLWARRMQRAAFELNDYLAVGGLVFALAESLFTIHSNIYWQLGSDSTVLGHPEAMMRYVILQVKALIVGQILWAAAAFFIRASMFALYIRIFRTKSFRIACYIIHAVNAAYFFTIIFAALLICRPISAMWDPQAGSCGNQKALDLYMGIFNLLLDVTAVLLPMPVLWRLQMSINKKVILSGIFGMGAIICILTLIRIKITAMIHGENAQKMYSLIALLTCLEVLLGVINACLPVMRPVFTKFGKSKIWSTFTSTLTGRRSLSRSTGHGGRSGAGYHKSKGSTSGNEMRVWPSSAAPGDPLAPRYVDAKAANMMFSHQARSPNQVPRPPPKSPYYQPQKSSWSDDEKAVEITVQRSWDVERAESMETDDLPLKDDEAGGKGW